MIQFFTTLWSVLSQILSVVSHTAQAAEDIAITAQLHTGIIRQKTEVELNHELTELRAQLALPKPKPKTTTK